MVRASEVSRLGSSHSRLCSTFPGAMARPRQLGISELADAPVVRDRKLGRLEMAGACGPTARTPD